jgi:SacI homology domain/Inositol phosphatase
MTSQGTYLSSYQKAPHPSTRPLIRLQVKLHLIIPLLIGQFYWNHHLASDFLESGQQDFVLPLVQGFVGQREFTVPSVSATLSDDAEQIELKDISPAGSPEDKTRKTYLLTLISRRSIHRAGLRYLRRGIDDDGWVANSVETEQIFSASNWTPENEESGILYSYLQYRGSIPLFFSQSPYSLKPIPIFRGTPEANKAAFAKHIGNLIERYGRVQAVSLVDKKATEAKAGQYYEDIATEAQKNDPYTSEKLAFEWFDFHSVCKGMRFENVSILFDTIKDNLSSFGWTEQVGHEFKKSQTGVLRTNCMDCLDRTNVVQSACGRIVLERQFEELGISLDLQKDASTSWFNTLWADNGDAISRQYAGTAALKGFGLTLTRYYNNIVNDYFTQASMDFLLGNADEDIFVDFEADMKSQDYAIDLRKVRQGAIETCTLQCIEDPDEKVIAGWALSCPRQPGTLRSYPFEEAVLLLTHAALYFCRMDWTIEKIKSFERVDLDFIEDITRGTYISSTFATRGMDPKRNVGFTFQYSTVGKSLVRINTRSLTSAEANQKPNKTKKAPVPASKILAFRALPPRSYYTSANAGYPHPLNEEESIKVICDQIAEAVNNFKKSSNAGDEQQSPTAPEISEPITVKEGDILSLADAKRSTGYLESLGNSIKKLVWAS